jgi:alpha 1,3-glucosidase
MSATLERTTTSATVGQVRWDLLSSQAFIMPCSLGKSLWLDFLNPSVQEWWSSLFLLDCYQGSSQDLFIWNDMNEPAIFGGPEGTMPKQCIHFNGWHHDYISKYQIQLTRLVFISLT